jgi:hypothetical protein
MLLLVVLFVFPAPEHHEKDVEPVIVDDVEVPIKELTDDGELR